VNDLIRQINESAKGLPVDEDTISKLYDQYAPALYGRIMEVVKQKEIAEKILERVFINAFVDKNVVQNDHIRLFSSLINHSRKKTYSTMKALRVLESLRCEAGNTSTAV
jgi:hypothetical protein